MWRSLNTILYNKTEQTNIVHSITEEYKQNGIISNKIYTDPQNISNVLNNYFGNIGKHLYEQIEESNINCNLEIQIPINNNTIYLGQATIDEIKIKIKILKPSDAINDTISSNMLKKIM